MIMSETSSYNSSQACQAAKKNNAEYVNVTLDGAKPKLKEKEKVIVLDV